MIYSILGLLVGLLISLTGIGGAAITTPTLILLGLPASVAVGTDLLFIFVIKLLAVILQHKNKNVHWKIVGLLALGGIPSSLLSIWSLGYIDKTIMPSNDFIVIALATIIIVAAIAIIYRQECNNNSKCNLKLGGGLANLPVYLKYLTIIILGVVVASIIAFTSVGSGSLVDVMLLTMFPQWSMVRIVSTGLAFAIPISLISGVGHLLLGNIDYGILAYLLVGAIPGVVIGVNFGAKLKNKALIYIISMVLITVGVYLIIKTLCD